MASCSPTLPRRSRRRVRSSPRATDVLYSKYGGTEIKVYGEDLLVLRESEVLAIVES